MRSLKSFETLKTNREFQEIYRSAYKKHSDDFVVFFLPRDAKKVGFTATKKIGNAVKRNRAKRLLRAMFIEVSDDLNDGVYIFVAKDSITHTPFSILLKSFKKSLNKLKAYDN